MRQHLAGVNHELLENIVLLGRQPHLRPPTPDAWRCTRSTLRSRGSEQRPAPCSCKRWRSAARMPRHQVRSTPNWLASHRSRRRPRPAPYLRLSSPRLDSTTIGTAIGAQGADDLGCRRHPAARDRGSPGPASRRAASIASSAGRRLDDAVIRAPSAYCAAAAGSPARHRRRDDAACTLPDHWDANLLPSGAPVPRSGSRMCEDRTAAVSLRLAATIVPPCASMKPLQIASPSPVPGALPVATADAIELARRCARDRSGGMPGPSSSTAMTTVAIASRRPEISIIVPPGAYFAALSSRLTSTCSIKHEIEREPSAGRARESTATR